ncbi:B-cell receptor-associated protein 3 [Spatholobus suberectus]|nr:B-cell receptor-associated protein 3 [Spatholobus suberectus]
MSDRYAKQHNFLNSLSVFLLWLEKWIFKNLLRSNVGSLKEELKNLIRETVLLKEKDEKASKEIK